MGSGFRFQVRKEYSPSLGRLWAERPPRYSRALLETLALIVYRQPITRGEIEDIRGVSVASSILKTLLEREWIRVLGHRDVPGRPALYGTTRAFLDSFNLKSLDELPPLAQIKDLDQLGSDLFGAAPVEVAAVETGMPPGDSPEESPEESLGEPRGDASDTSAASDSGTDEVQPAAEPFADTQPHVDEEAEKPETTEDGEADAQPKATAQAGAD